MAAGHFAALPAATKFHACHEDKILRPFSEAKVEASKAMENWRAQRAQLEPKLEEIKKSGQEAGQEIKAGCAAAVAELERAFERIKSRFKE